MFQCGWKDEPAPRLDKIPTSICEFFSAEEYENIPEYERMHLSNMRQNFEVLKRYGLPVQPPEFMVRNKSEKERKALMIPSDEESSSGSDSEWTPAVELTHKLNEPRERPKNRQKAGTRNGLQSKYSVPSKRKKVTGFQPPAQKKTSAGKDEDEIHQYPFRHKRITSYMSLAIPDDDDFLYCEECNFEYDGDCPEHGPLHIVQDAEVPSTIKKGVNQDYCVKTLPPGLAIKKSKIPGAGMGIFALKDFPVRTRFGPYGGKKEKNEEVAHESGYCWQIFSDGKPSHFVDARDPCHSNWMRFVNCARSEDEQSVTAYQYQGEIYYRAHRNITAGTEILVYYGDSYARDLGIQTQRVGNLGQRVYSRNVQQNFKEPPGDEDGNVYSCAHCYLAFSCALYLQRHERRMHSHLTDTSKYANRPTGLTTFMSQDQTMDEAVQTQENIHKEVPENDLCRKPCSESENVQADKRSYTGEKPYKCDVCCKAFSQNGSLEKHKRTHTGEKPYKCDMCSKAFSRNGNLQTHKRTHTGEKPYKCDMCSKAFSTSCELQTHKRTHTGEKPYKCDMCSKAFSQNGNLQSHKRTHTGEKPYKCDMCSKAFSTSGDLQSHKRSHTGEKPYKCDMCSKAYSQSGHLQTHKRTHTGEKPYKCDICSKAFSQGSHLQDHKRTHTGDKPYKCDMCRKAFSRSSHLQRHKRTHTGDKPYKCDMCRKAFSRSSHLQTHKRTHTGDKPYKCDMCSKAFSHISNLQTHKRTHTGENFT